MKWLIAAAGKGTRLQPTTLHTNKHLIPVGTVSMIQRMHAFTSLHKPEKVLVCVNEGDAQKFEAELGTSPYDAPWRVYEQNGYGVAGVIKTARQKGLISENEPFVLVLGDQFFTSSQEVDTDGKGCHVHVVRVPASAAGKYGVLDRLTLNVIEKPTDIQDSQDVLAVVGLYTFPKVTDAQLDAIKPSARGELEISDLLNAVGVTSVSNVRGEWCDMGTWEGIRAAANFIEAVVDLDAVK